MLLFFQFDKAGEDVSRLACSAVTLVRNPIFFAHFFKLNSKTELTAPHFLHLFPGSKCHWI